MLLGLGQTSVDEEIDGLLLAHPRPTQGDVEDFLKLYLPGEARNIAARGLIARGIPSDMVAKALAFVNTTSTIFNRRNVIGTLTVLSALFSGVHGFKRNNGSIGWGLWWFIGGSIFPIVTPVLAMAQGYAKKRAS